MATPIDLEEMARQLEARAAASGMRFEPPGPEPIAVNRAGVATPRIPVGEATEVFGAQPVTGEKFAQATRASANPTPRKPGPAPMRPGPGPGVQWTPPTGTPPTGTPPLTEATASARPAGFADPGAPGTATGGATPAKGVASIRDRAFGSGAEWKQFGDKIGATADDVASALKKERALPGPGVIGKAIGKIAPYAAIAEGGYNAFTGAREGDYGRMGLGLADATAGGLLATPAAPAAATYLAGRAAYQAPEAIRSALGSEGLEKVGGVINQIGLNTGLWGVDDSKLLEANAKLNGPSLPVRQPTSPTPAPNTLTDVQRGGAADSVAEPAAPASIRDPYTDRYDPRYNVNVMGDQRARDYYASQAAKWDADNLRGPSIQPIEAVNAIDKANMKHDREVQLATLDRAARLSGSLRERMTAREAYAKLTEQPMPWEAAQEGERRQTGETTRAGIRERGETVRNTNTNANARSIRAADNATTERGQDLTLMGHRMTNAVARDRLRQEQDNKDRQYELDKAKFGVETADKNRAAAEQSTKNLHAEVMGLLPTIDGKPDADTAARYVQGINNAVANLAATTTDPKVKAMIEQHGVGALDVKDKRRLVAGMQLADLASATATGGLTPWGTRAIQSNAPIMAIKRLPNGDYQTNRRGVNGETEIIPGRYIEKEGSTLGIGGRASDKFKALME